MGTDRYSTTWPRRGNRSCRQHGRLAVKGGFTGYAPHTGETCLVRSRPNRITVRLYRRPYFNSSSSLAIFTAILRACATASIYSAQVHAYGPLMLSGGKREFAKMSEATQVSRRRAFSLLGLATFAFALPTQVLISSDAEAQQTTPPAGQQAAPSAGQSTAAPEHGTRGMKRRKNRRTRRKERRKKRHGGGEATQQQK